MNIRQASKRKTRTKKTTIFTEIVFGKDLSKEDLAIINHHRKIEFHSDTLIAPLPINDDWEKPYFLVRDGNGKLVSFGRLHYLEVLSRQKRYPILGIATILSIEKRKGYGRMILEEMKKFVAQKKITAIGFCDTEDTGFYEKCGLGIIKNGTDRFIFPRGSKSEEPGDVLYIEGEDNLIKSMLRYPDDKVTAFRPGW